MAIDPIDLIVGMEVVPATRGSRRDNIALAVALARAGALPVVQFRANEDGSLVEAVASRSDGPIAVQPQVALTALEEAQGCSLPTAVTTAVMCASVVPGLIETGGLGKAVALWSRLRVLVEITSLEEARLALEAGADGLIAKGCESGGRVGDTETFVLLQQAVDLGVPVWARGGIGLHTAAGAIALGARGVVLDSQLSLVRESRLPSSTRLALAAMDGSETRIVGSHRIYTRPDLPAAYRQVLERPEVIATQLGPDVASDLFPVGQDGASAELLARRFKTAGGVVDAFRRSIGAHVGAASVHTPLRPGGGIAETHHIRYPIVQGPMTRVSDRAAFAAAVADNGGLPFLALALMPRSEVEPLLEATSELLRNRPWGVGILGFVPPEVREEQLAAVVQARVPVALIAGGRPSQASPLEDAGIATYLHVPSPGLLDRFVKDGARRFVFEGRECGGHVGPRSSLALWEAQVDRLCEVPDAESLHVLFAGGIHDARSAAAVAVIGAPLAARGAHLGVLMGTAYLFTAEAVLAGAITPRFQETVLNCERTALLETSPGHSTRCADTQYVTTFADTRAELEANDVSTKEMWAQLETLNLGRLRVASKGLAHGDDELVAVDEETQSREGLYMLGQVATLRRDLTSVAELHHEVSAESTNLVRSLPTRIDVVTGESGRTPQPLDIAIIGMASMFPGSSNVDEFWTTIVNGINSITEVPSTRWAAELYFDPHAMTVGAGRKTPSKWGGFLTEVAFDPLAYGIPPASLAAIEPVQLLSLEAATQALADAGYADREFDRSRASVIFGAANGNDLSGAYGLRAMLPALFGETPSEVDDFLPTLTEDSFPGVLTNVIAGRIANRLNLGGINFTVDAACAASLASLDVACKELISGNSDVVLCGAADVHNGINDFLLFSSVHALSPTGQCRTFDKEADGIALGEGIACIVLKRRIDAERDGDRIYAVIQSVAGSSDGRHLGLTAPRKEGQQLALERAYAISRRSPRELGLVEAHGTGTVVGDKTELAALSELWEAHDAGVGTCVLGSVKSQIGHTKCAAGLAGLIKVVHSLYRGVLPPTVNLAAPNAAYDATSSPFRFLDGARPWVDDERHAAVSAFGFGGSNFHAVVSSYAGDDVPPHGVDSWPAELFLFRAENGPQALDRVAQLAIVVEGIVRDDPKGQRHRMRDLAATVAASGSGPIQVAIVASGFGDLAEKLGVAMSNEGKREGVFLADAGSQSLAPASAKTAFLYPGQGSQRTGMLAELFVTFPHLRDLLGTNSEWSNALYPPAAFTAEQRAAQSVVITDTRVAQPVLGLCGLAMTRLLASVGITSGAMAGHSYGELVALSVAGVFDSKSLLELSEARGNAIVNAATADDSDPGAMAAVSAPLGDIEKVLANHPGVVVANHNGPSQTVISGTSSAVATVVEELASAGVAAKTLNVACAFHSPIVAAASSELERELSTIPVEPPRVPVWSNATAQCYPSEPAEIRGMVADQLTRPVRFVEEIEAMYEAGVRIFVEAGPGRVLTQLVDKILKDRPHRAIATDVQGEHGVHRFLLALGELAVAGFDVQTDVLFAGRALELDTSQLPVPAPAWTVDGHLVRTATGDIVAGGLRPSDQFPQISAGVVNDPVREATVLEYFRGLREMVAAERDVMLRYLGAPVEAGPASAPTSTPALRDLAAKDMGLSVQPVDPDAVSSTSQAVPSAPLTGDELVSAVLQVVADRTGYPTDMLDLDLDLEADLSIDSIKRVEIIGELAERIGLAPAGGQGIDDSVVETLAHLKSLREIVAWIGSLDGATTAAGTDTAVPTGVSAASSNGASPPDTALGSDGAIPDLPARAIRHVVKTVGIDAPSASLQGLDGARVLIADDTRGVAPRVAATLGQSGASVSIVAADDSPTEDELELLRSADGLIWLRALHPDASNHPQSFDSRAAFRWWQPAVLGGVTRLVTATAGGGSFVANPSMAAPGLGLAGMLKAIGREVGDRTLRAIDLDPSADPGALAVCIVEEFCVDEHGLAEVGYDGLQRVTRVVVADPHDETTARPVDRGEPLTPDRTSEPVVLVTGGGRGIGACAAVAIARLRKCHMELAGRSPLPAQDEAPYLAAAVDARSLRKALVDTGAYSTPAAVEAECSRLLAAREIRATLATISALGRNIRYHQVDVRDSDALGRVVKDIYGRFGRLDLVVHAAGILDDHLLRDKSQDGFDRVFATKVDAARTLLDTTGTETDLVFYGSISGVFGNRGQVDYAAANDALDELAEAANRSRPGRVVSIDWGPWTGTGMVSPELEREYSRRGIGLIDQTDGTEALLTELAAPSTSVGRVVVMRARPEVLAGEPNPSQATETPRS